MRTSSYFVLLGCVLLAGCGTDSVEVDNPGLDGASDGIVGGTTFTGLPAVGSLTVDGEEYCTGTLIGPRKVLTAAHCLEDPTASQMHFVIGARLSSPDYTLNVASIKQHPSYNSSTITNDVGLVTLSQDAPIASLDVNKSMDSSWVGTALFFVGYGVTNAATNSGAGKKRSVWITISDVSTKTFDYGDPGKNTCYGDSGGPALLKESNGSYLVAGVTSYGDQNCAQYGVDTRVDAFLDFIGATGGSSSSGGTTSTCTGTRVCTSTADGNVCLTSSGKAPSGVSPLCATSGTACAAGKVAFHYKTAAGNPYCRCVDPCSP